MTSTPVILPEVAVAEATGQPVLIKERCGSHTGENNSVCGDYSITAEPSAWAVWATGKADEPYVMIEATYFVEAWLISDEGNKQLDYADWSDLLIAADEERPEIRYSLQCQTHYLVCTDLDDFGGTEVRSDYSYDTVGSLWSHTAASCLKDARREAAREDWSHYSPENV